MLKVNGEAVECVRRDENGQITKACAVPVYEEANGITYDVLYVRLRAELNETEEQAMDRAERIAEVLNTPIRRLDFNPRHAFRAGGAS